MSDNPNPKLALALHGVNLQLEAKHAPFLAYARRYLVDFPLADDNFVPDVRVCLHWDALPSLPETGRGVQRRGRRLIQWGNRILQTEILYLPGLQLEAEWSGETLLIDAYYQPTSRLERVAHRFNREIPRLFIILIYYLVYFPFIYYLEQTRGWYVLHAGAIDHPAGGRILAGLPGSGKSTFITSLLADRQAKLLSENLLLFDAQQVYTFPEPIHLSAESQALLPPAARQRLVELGREFSHSRHDFSLPPSERAWQTRPQSLYFLGLADRMECAPIPTDVTISRLLAFDQMAKEVNAYAQFAAALELIARQPGRMQQYQQALAALISVINCYDLWLEQGGELAQATPLALSSEFVQV